MIEKLPDIGKKKDSVQTKSQQKQHQQRETRKNEKKVIHFRVLNYMFYNLN